MRRATGRVGFVLCILSIAINVASFAGSLPVDAQGMLGWQRSGSGIGTSSDSPVS